MSDEPSAGFDPAVGFVRASSLYDLDQGEPVAFDWPKLQPVDASQDQVERAVAGILDGSDVEQTG